MAEEEEGASSSHIVELDQPAPVDAEQLVAKPRSTSIIWKYFGFEADDKGKPRKTDRPICRLYQTEVSAKDGNTANLYSHLKSKHGEEYLQIQKERPNVCKPNRPSSQPSLSEMWKKTQMIPSNSREHKDITKSITYCLAKDMLPISTVDKPGFKAMVYRFNPRYQLPSRNFFSRVAIPALSSELKSDIEQHMTRGLDFFSGTTDLWTSTAGDPYLSFTCHFIDCSWELQSFCLCTQYLPEDHTAANIQEALSDTLKCWKLDVSKLVGITTDSGANVKAACRLLKWQRLTCFGHNLNLAVEKGLDDLRVQRVLRKCKSVVATFSRSWKKQRDLAVSQEQKGLPQHKLKLNVVTHWGSSYEMVERMIEQMEAVRIVLASDRQTSHLIPLWQDCDVLDSISTALKSLKEMTDALSGEKCVTVSAVLPLLKHITSKILVEKDDDTNLTKEIKQRIKADLELRYADQDLIHLLEIASFLDPRFKLEYVEGEESLLKEIEERMLQISEGDCVDDTFNDQSGELSVADEPPAKKSKGLSSILGKCLDATSRIPLTHDEKVTQELKQYLSHPKLDMEDSPLLWWNVEETRYPHLAILARKFLCVCATSVPSERVFSCGGQIVTDRRAALKPDRVDQLIFLARNLP